MIIIRKMIESDLAEVKTLSVEESQTKYVGTTSEILQHSSDTNHFHVIQKNKSIIGFFIIDTAYHQQYSFVQERELGLRAFLIDKSLQGNGLGKQAVMTLIPYLKSAYKEWTSITLTVNCQNPGAYKCYLAGGFTDTGELYKEGPAGPQYIMRMDLK
ncbi:GNAT family N-acetyltransferase [Spartinivicinus poritis]|uniref:GNAT family N-acetyltransferase n=1 Tax=Spartinivicinus poritis TaxID=2994640 RepID=A0ABT5UFD3_9GAMM|nr:GNAT family N-acetyltransferase [Spartinivicinus sp. A2-2]MDE1464217.1 GNAT family N-acetyltransferase [Spartinivicinus sp. A2-2]